MTININNIAFDINTISQDTCQRWGYTNNHYNVEISVNGKSVTIDYYTGIMASFDDEWENDCATLLYCFISNAMSYLNNDIDTFASEFGYEKVSELLQAYNGCKDEAMKANELALSPTTMGEIYDTLVSDYNL